MVVPKYTYWLLPLEIKVLYLCNSPFFISNNFSIYSSETRPSSNFFASSGFSSSVFIEIYTVSSSLKVSAIVRRVQKAAAFAPKLTKKELRN